MTRQSSIVNVDEFLALRKEAGLAIDPATAEIISAFRYVSDPYAIYEVQPDEDCI
jgi:hypothetical protein